LQAAGDRNLLAFLLAFPWGEIRANIDFEFIQRLDRYGCVVPITDFFEANDIRLELGKIAMDCANLPVLFLPGCIGTAARKPLNVPKRGSDDC
jgi:hypothetical protein